MRDLTSNYGYDKIVHLMDVHTRKQIKEGKTAWIQNLNGAELLEIAKGVGLEVTETDKNEYLRKLFRVYIEAQKSLFLY